jgi:tetratricopeptide (TPR) repeat protein
METGSAYAHAQNVLRELKLSPDKQAVYRCLEALHNSELGQLKLSGGDSEGALPLLQKAHNGFETIPAALYLLGITKTDIAAAYGNLGAPQEASQYAQEALYVLAGTNLFPGSESMAHMTLGMTLHQSGRPDEGRSHLRQARQILEKMPDGEKYLAVLDQNESALEKESHKSKKSKKWWPF